MPSVRKVSEDGQYQIYDNIYAVNTSTGPGFINEVTEKNDKP